MALHLRVLGWDARIDWINHIAWVCQVQIQMFFAIRLGNHVDGWKYHVVQWGWSNGPKIWPFATSSSTNCWAPSESSRTFAPFLQGAREVGVIVGLNGNHIRIHWWQNEPDPYQDGLLPGFEADLHQCIAGGCTQILYKGNSHLLNELPLLS